MLYGADSIWYGSSPAGHIGRVPGLSVAIVNPLAQTGQVARVPSNQMPQEQVTRMMGGFFRATRRRDEEDREETRRKRGR